MPSTEFVAVSFSPNQLLDKDTLSQMNNNLTIVRDESVDGAYMNPTGGVTRAGVKLLCGKATVPPTKNDTGRVGVSFSTMFNANCVPIITTGLQSTHQYNLFVVFNGIGKLHPDHRGFVANINVGDAVKAKDKILRTVYLNWMAMGY